MQYIEALTPPTVMAVFFGLMIRALFRNQGGAAAAKEDAVAEAITSSQSAQ
ncbi:hypothetical protein [Streptacidiphilus fuscans]|uniref:Uncharacterized protein n=1 Tax=Streptacidiphilus fuscans TaxID=2789292 RepID=A0A931BHG4_9ACTN|nr:hypothetical protein [Streptacidiphilus fuscans]MBF9073530.1 hypothetical protein [Streptacidiphilus fuscans]